MNDNNRSSTAAVPELADESQVKSKVGHVAKFNYIDDNISRDDEFDPTPSDKIQFNPNDDQQIYIQTEHSTRSSQPNEILQFIGLTKEVNNIYSIEKIKFFFFLGFKILCK